MSERKVKGTMLVDQVRMIRKNKDKNWESFFTPEEWQTINSKILDPAWYPQELFSKIGHAVFEVIAGKDLNLVRSRGRERAKELFQGVYRSVIIKDDPMRSLKKFINIYEMFFNFSLLTMETVGDTHVKFQYDFDLIAGEHNNAYAHQLMGLLEALLELSGGRNVKIALTAKQWENAPATVFDIQWS